MAHLPKRVSPKVSMDVSTPHFVQGDLLRGALQISNPARRRACSGAGFRRMVEPFYRLAVTHRRRSCSGVATCLCG